MRLVAFALTLLAFAAPAVADDIAWRAPKGCPTAKSVRARVEKRLDHSLDDVPVPVEVDVSRHGNTYTATVDLRAVTVANDVRTLRAKRCAELADAVAVIVARVAGDVLASGASDAGSSTDVIAFADDPVTPTTLEPAPPALPHGEPIDDLDQGPAPVRPWTLGARVSGVSGIGVIPQVGIGAELAVSLRRHDALAEVGATRWLTSTAQFHNGRPAKVDVALDVVSLRGGWRPARLPLRAWLAVESGTMRGTSVSLPTDQLAGGRWLASGVGFGVAWQMTPWIRLFGATETMVAIERVRFTGGDGIVVYAPSPMSVRTLCGIELGWQ